MTVLSAGLAGDTTVLDLLSSLNALQVLSMVMVDASGEDEILDLAVSAVPSLGRNCLVDGVWLDGKWWRAEVSPRGQVGCPAGLEGQLALLGSAGGLLSSPGRGWLWAFPMVSRGGASGCLVVSSLDPPPQHERALLQTLAQQTVVAISHARLLERERAMHARIADEQATLRRVASLVSRGVPPAEAFAAVAAEAGRLLEADFGVMSRYQPDGTATIVGAWAKGDVDHPLPAGTHVAPGGTNVHTLVQQTGRPSRIDDYGDDQSIGATIARQWGVRSAVGAPIHIGGRLWGAIIVGSRRQEPLPADTEGWLSGFTELVATAIANTEAQVELRGHAEEQAALRRVATLVAERANAEDVFAAVAQEVARAFDVQVVTVCRYETDALAVLSSFGTPEFPAGGRWPLEVPSFPGSILRTGRPARPDDLFHASGLDVVARDMGVTSAVGAPILVGGRVWGSINVALTNNERFPPDTEEQLARFSELVATSVSNAKMREELAASRVRIVAAGDNARRRIERDLHDGAQQRLVTLAVALRRAEARIPAGLGPLRAEVTRVAEGLTTAVDELRELSRGIHPSILTEGGLSPALKALGRRAAVRVKLDVGFENRLPDHAEVAAYYSVSEALTNASKHANASRVWVALRLEDDMLLLSVRDDGVGGADAHRGSGLTGLTDRIEALGGKVQIESPPGGGTSIELQIPTGRELHR